MIDREEFKKIQNIVSLTNTENIDIIDSVLAALVSEQPYRACSLLIKNSTNLESLNDNFDTFVRAIDSGDKISLYTTLFKIVGNNIHDSLVENVLKTIKDMPEHKESLLDSVSNNQVASKYALLNAVDNLNFLDKDSTVVIWGSWYGSILIPALTNKVKKIVSIDLDETPLQIAKNRLFANYKNIEYVCDDIFKTYRDVYLNTNLIINTSCEHMLPMKEWKWFQKGALATDSQYKHKFESPKLSDNCYFAFQSNNMFGIEGHVNCVNSLQEFKDQMPERAEILFEEEVEDTRGTRYMLVGKLTSL